MPELRPFETDAGTSLVKETLNAQDDSVRGDPPTIVDEMQTPITSQADLTAKQEGPTERLWVIPAVCYRRERTLDGETVRPRPCPTCGETTDHVHTSTTTHHADPEKRAYWICLECGDGHRDVPPATGEYKLRHYDDYDYENYPAINRKGKSEQRQLFETVMQHIERSERLVGRSDIMADRLPVRWL